MINATQIRKGMVIRLNEKVYRVEEMKHITPGKGNAVVQTKIRDLADLSIRDYRFRSADKIERVMVETKKYLYSYQDGDQYIFMDNETYEQITLDEEFLKDILFYLKENEDYFIEFISDKPVNITPPLSMEYEVAEAEESIKGATVQSSYKPAKLDNGMKIMVPAFIEPGNRIKVDTRDGTYIERVKK
jgi:elongation factor P